ncbi:uncharacterized protein LOC144200514 [Stigmatopora nigra]
MPRDMSSSSEDEVDEATTQTSPKPKEIVKSNYYKCPDDFVSFSHKPCSSTLAKNLKNTENELWLVKAPASFDPRCLRGVDVNLSGFQTLKLPSAAAHGSHGVQLYNVVSSDRGPADLRLLTTGSSPAEIGPAFSGLLSICESYGGDRPSPHVIHADPAPDIIPGLKQRFQPFGSKTPVSAYEDKKKKKKKKKDKKDLPVKIEDVPVEEENEEKGQEHRPKKRKKKDRDNDDDDQNEKALMLQVKIEPEQDVLLQEDEPVKKKKKKKKDRNNDDDDDDEQREKEVMVQVKIDPEEEEEEDAALLQEDEPAKKKKKKKKSKSEQD